MLRADSHPSYDLLLKMTDISQQPWDHGFNVVSLTRHRTNWRIITHKLPSSSSSSSRPYLEVGLTFMAGVWDWGLPASGSLVLSPLAEEREISPVHKHTGITHYSGLMDAWMQCWTVFLEHVYLCKLQEQWNRGFLLPCSCILKITCGKITSTESQSTLILLNIQTNGGKISQQILINTWQTVEIGLLHFKIGSCLVVFL